MLQDLQQEAQLKDYEFKMNPLLETCHIRIVRVIYFFQEYFRYMSFAKD